MSVPDWMFTAMQPPLYYEVYNINTGERHKWEHMEDAFNDFKELEKNGAAHGAWRLVSILLETVF